MKENIYDYWIKTPQAPAFEDNINLMLDRVEDEGSSPTLTKRGRNHAVGTTPNAGLALLHFRLPQRMTEAEVLAWLEQDMIAPLPKLTVLVIRSAFEHVYVDDGLDGEGNPIGHYEFETIVAGTTANFNVFLPDETDVNGDPIPGQKSPYLSTYYGTAPIELI